MQYYHLTTQTKTVYNNINKRYENNLLINVLYFKQQSRKPKLTISLQW